MRAVFVALVLAVCVGRAWGDIDLKSVQEWGKTPLSFTYDAYQKNVIYALYTPHYGDDFVISIHYFEDLLVPPHSDFRYYHNRRIDLAAFNYHREGDRLIYEITQENPVRFECRFEVYSRGDTIFFEGWIHNREALIDWHGTGLICLRLREHDDFYDIRGNQVYVTNRFTRERISIFDACGVDYSFFFLPTLDETSQYLPFIEKEDLNHQFRARIQTWPANGVGGNRIQSMSCIHCDLRLDVPAGKTVDFRSEVRMMEIEPNCAGQWTLYD